MTYNIIQHKGRQTQARTDKGILVKRAESFFTQEYGVTPCADYDEHFLYEIPDTPETKGQSSFRCTCGSIAVIANPYKKGNMFVCLNHATYGFHTTSQVNKADFAKGEPVIMKGKKWV